MRIFDRAALRIPAAVIMSAMISGGVLLQGLVGTAQANEPAPVAAGASSVNAAPAELAEGLPPVEAFRIGVRAYVSRDFRRALSALEHAAKRGHAIAKWKLGMMYSKGDGVVENDAKAFDYFRQIANAHAEDNPNSRLASVYASAFVQLGSFYSTGLTDGSVQRNMSEAVRMYSHAATYFGDPDAQYHLAKLYLEGEGVPRNPDQCLRWLNSAAKKNHVRAQALLGDLLISGVDVAPRPANGLKWLYVAREFAGPQDRDWVLSLLYNAEQATSDAQKAHARLSADAWIAQNQPGG